MRILYQDKDPKKVLAVARAMLGFPPDSPAAELRERQNQEYIDQLFVETMKRRHPERFRTYTPPEDL